MPLHSQHTHSSLSQCVKRNLTNFEWNLFCLCFYFCIWFYCRLWSEFLNSHILFTTKVVLSLYSNGLFNTNYTGLVQSSEIYCITLRMTRHNVIAFAATLNCPKHFQKQYEKHSFVFSFCFRFTLSHKGDHTYSARTHGAC